MPTTSIIKLEKKNNILLKSIQPYHWIVKTSQAYNKTNLHYMPTTSIIKLEKKITYTSLSNTTILILYTNSLNFFTSHNNNIQTLTSIL
jgi:hypothetical protein